TGAEGGWRSMSIVAVVLLLAAIVVQAIAWFHPGFGTKDGGYASVFFGWTGFYSAVLLGSVYWLWTQVAQSLRGSGGSGDGGTPCFLAAMASIVLALQPPLDSLVGTYLWAHMVQHLVLLGVAAPLLVLSAPWLRVWRGLPLGWRRGLARTLVMGGWSAPLRR